MAGFNGIGRSEKLTLFVNRYRSTATARLLERLRHSQVARTGYWMMTPFKNPARIAFIRQLVSNNEQLLALNATFAANIEHLSNQSVELAANIEHLNQQNAKLVSEIEHQNEQNAELVSKIEQLDKQNAELVSRLDRLTEQSALDRPLAFMQAPKTSGSALTTGLCDVLPSTARIHGWDHAFFGAFREFETMSSGVRQDIYQTLPPANGADFVYGQFAYSTIVQSRPAARLMTVLREPRTRLLSLWLYWRSFSDDDHAAAGAWGRVQRLTRQPLAEFLNHPEAACQTDNVYVRRLLSPHPLIPDDGFIDSAADERLASEAVARLRAFDFTDIVENPRLEDNVRGFVARPFVYQRVNETDVRSESGFRLEEELAGETLLLVEHRSRLDRELWRAVASERIAGVDPTVLSDDTFRRTITRYAALISAE